MADEPKGALDPDAVSAAADDAVPQNAAEDITDAGDSGAEDEVAKLRQELEEQRETLKNQAALMESWKGKVEQANRQEAASSPATADPMTTQIAQLDDYATQLAQQEAAAKAAGQLTPELQRWINKERITTDGQKGLLAMRRDFEFNQRKMAEAEPVFAKDKEFGERARVIFQQSRAANAQDAITLARGEAVSNRNITAEARQREADEDARRKSAGKPATGGAPSSNGSASRTKLPFSVYLQRVNAGDSKLAKQNDLGLLELDYTR